MKFSLLPLSAALALSAQTHADEVTVLTDVVVTATRSAEVAPTVPNSTVITREEIATRQPSSVTELLQQEAGINVGSNGGPLTLNSVFLRGTSSKQMLILVDGVRMSDANQGAFDLSQLRPDDIERIEIARGPYSSQYGSDAIGGVIQIFTRKSRKAEASVRAGSYGTQEYNAGASIGDSKNGLSVRGGYLSTDGFSATNKHYYSPNPDRDGGLAKTGMLSGQTEISSTVSASFSSTWKDSSVEIDNGISDQQLGTASAELKQKVTDSWSQRLQLGWLRDNIDTDDRYDPDPYSVYYSHFRTERDNVSWLHDLQWAEGWKLVGGIDHYTEKANSGDLLAGTTTFDKKLSNTGIFVTQYGESGIFSGSASLRQDHHETFGNHTTGSASFAAQVAPRAKIYTAYGTAFRAPSANDLYYPGYFGFYAGNPELKPESSEQVEVGTELTWLGQRLRLSGYHNRLTDMITSSAVSPYALLNVASATLQGLELEMSGKLQRFNYSLNASQQSAKDSNGTWLQQRPRASLNTTLGYALTDTVNAGAEVRARSDSKSGSAELPGYTLLNLYAGWQLAPSLNLGARLENLGNKEYQVVNGYNTAERSGYVSATYTWR